MESTSASVPGAPGWEQVDEVVPCPLCDYDLRMLTLPRCAECGYSDVLISFGTLAMFVPLGSLAGTLLWPGLQVWPGIVLVVLALWTLAAYRLYMRFDHPFATTLSAQLITFLVLANIYGPFFCRHVGPCQSE